MEFEYNEMFPLGKDTTQYHLLTKDYVSVANFEGKEIIKVSPEGIRLLTRQAFHDVSFMLRPEHNDMVAKILKDPEASVNDKAVAITMLLNANVSVNGQLPICQDTGTATIVAKKGQNVYTGGGDEAAISHGVYDTYTKDNLRYS
ncbi:MAG: fumarate hydratase, partial [Bacteroidales bacterium]